MRERDEYLARFSYVVRRLCVRQAAHALSNRSENAQIVRTASTTL